MKTSDPWWEEQRRKWDEEGRAASIRRRNEILSERSRLEAYPAFELVLAGVPDCAEDKKKAWEARWTEAGNRVDWLEAAPAFLDKRRKLRMIAMVTSPIWAELGRIGRGSAEFDTPPFLPGSVWHWQDITEEELLQLGLMDQQTLDSYVEMHAPPYDEGETAIAEALKFLSPAELAQLERELNDLT